MASEKNTAVCTSKAAPPIGPYSQGIVASGGKTVYVSGQGGVNPETKKLAEGGLAAEADQTLKNIGAILEAAGCTYADVVKCTV